MLSFLQKVWPKEKMADGDRIQNTDRVRDIADCDHIET